MPSRFFCIMLVFIFSQDSQQILFLIIANHNINTWIYLLLVLLRLHIASRSHHNRIRIHLPGPVEHLPGLAVRNVCHGTGVDNVDIRAFFKRNDLIPCILQHFLHRLSLVSIHFTPQIVQCNLLHRLILLFPCLNCCNGSGKPELLRIHPIEIRLRRKAGCQQPLCFRTVCTVNAQPCLDYYKLLLFSFFVS